MIDMSLQELLTGLDLSDDGILVTPEMLEAAKAALETWFAEQGYGEDDIDGLFAPALAIRIYRAMAVVDPVRNRFEVDEPDGGGAAIDNPQKPE
jgi:hypothetical protein